MATSNNTIKTRIKMKNATKDEWDELGPNQNSIGFVPLQGEVIVYLPDSEHSYSRLKIGDGSHNVVDLPFIDAGTVNGEQITDFDISTTTKSIGYIAGGMNGWSPGTMTTLTVEDNILKINTGNIPSLSILSTNVVTGVTKEAQV